MSDGQSEETASHPISPNFIAEKISPGELPDWIDVWEDRILNAYLLPARRLLDDPNAGYVILLLVVSTFEMLETYHRGEDSENRSGEFFRGAFMRFFGREPTDQLEDEEVAAAIYSGVRCGLTHSLMTYGQVFVSMAPEEPIFRVGRDHGELVQIVISAARFLEGMTTEVKRYVHDLRNGTGPKADGMRERFERAWHLTHEKTRGPIDKKRRHRR